LSRLFLRYFFLKSQLISIPNVHSRNCKNLIKLNHNNNVLTNKLKLLRENYHNIQLNCNKLQIQLKSKSRMRNKSVMSREQCCIVAIYIDGTTVNYSFVCIILFVVSYGITTKHFVDTTQNERMFKICIYNIHKHKGIYKYNINY